MRLWVHNPSKVASPSIPKYRVIITVTLVSMILIIVTGALVLEAQLHRPLQQWADSRITNLTTLAINRAVQGTLATYHPTNDWIQPLQGSDGMVGLSYAWGDLLGLKASITEAVVEAIDALATQTIPVPIGVLTGLRILGTSGPIIPVRIIPVGAVTTNMRFDFQSQGINQVLHRIYIDIQVRMQVLASLASAQIVIHEQVPITTELIQGQVPSAILNWNGTIEELRHNVPQP